MKVAELTESLLDYWVAQAEGVKVISCSGNVYPHLVRLADAPHSNYNPSTDPAQGHPIIERRRIATWHNADGWSASKGDPVTAIEIDGPEGEGPTALVAAMRCLVASVYGYSVPDVTL